MFGRHKSKEDEIHGEAIVTKSRSAGGIAGGGGTSATVWHLNCRLYLSAEHSVDFEDKVGSAFKSAGNMAFNVGDKVPVVYHPDHPEDAKVDVEAILTARQARRDEAESAQLLQAEHEQIEALGHSATPEQSQLSGCHMVITEVLGGPDKETKVFGTVRGGTMHVGDTVTFDYEHPTKIVSIETLKKPMTKVMVQEAGDGVDVGMTFASLAFMNVFKNEVMRPA